LPKPRNYALVLVVEDDDERVADFRKWLAHPSVRLLHVKTGDAALKCVESDKYDLILLDHDLDKHHPLGRLAPITGTKVVDRLVASRLNRQTRILIHSMNPGARDNMFARLQANGFDVEVRPFAEWTRESAVEVRETVLEDWEVEQG
jgi:CheY-like chemotaxis protein